MTRFVAGEDLPSLVLPEDAEDVGPLGTIFAWDVFWLLPLHRPDSSEVIGLLGVRPSTVNRSSRRKMPRT